VVSEQAKSALFEVVDALRPPPRFARCLDRGQKQTNEHANNGNDHQKFDKGKAGSPGETSGNAAPGIESEVALLKHNKTAQPRSIYQGSSPIEKTKSTVTVIKSEC
jgi:hypothetical protein